MAKQKCAEMIFNSSVYRSFPCSVGATVQDGSNWWCGIHSPEAKQKRKAKRDDRHAKWTAEFEAGIKRREAAQSQRDALSESHESLIKALEKKARSLHYTRGVSMSGLDRAHMHVGFEDCRSGECRETQTLLTKARALMPEK